jgi:chemotaxis protein CheC
MAVCPHGGVISLIFLTCVWNRLWRLNMLTDLQKDVLVEIMNTNIGFAASLLSEMVNQKVLLSVPELDLKKGSEFDFVDFLSRTSDFKTSVLSSISFGKNFSGNAYIIFPTDKAKDLVLACTESDCDYSDDDFNKLTTEDLDVLKEISNIIFNAVIGEFGNLLGVKLEYTLPRIEMTIIDNVEDTILPEDIHFLTMYTSFLLSKSQVKGMIFLALSVDSEQMLINKIDDMLVDING